MQLAVGDDVCADEGWIPLDPLDDLEVIDIAEEETIDAEVLASQPETCTAIVPYGGPVNLAELHKKGRKGWNHKGLFPRHGVSSQPETLRKAAYRIAGAEGGPRGTCVSSGKFGVIKDCIGCLFGCSLQWRFLLADAQTILVQWQGECQTPTPQIAEAALRAESSLREIRRSLKRRRLEMAGKYAKDYSPQEAIKQMKKDKVDKAYWPTERQLETQRRPEASAKPEPYPTDFLGLLKDFVDNPPPGVRIFKELVVLEPEEVRIPFASESVWLANDDFADLHVFLMDYTFNTNRNGLLLGVAGPAGLHIPRHYPAMRLLPVVFCVSRSEDARAHLILLELLELWRQRCITPTPFTDGVFDFACLTSAASYFKDHDPVVYLHRDLQHVLKDVKDAAKLKDDVTGKKRLPRDEFLPVLTSFIQWSAFLGTDLEFHTFWEETLSRMEAELLETDFREPTMAKYLKEHIFDLEGPLIRASWQSGQGAVPDGFTTWAANAIERTHRTLKDLYDTLPHKQSIGELIVETCNIMNARIESGYYKTLVHRIAKPPPILIKALERKNPPQTPFAEEGPDSGRDLDMCSIAEHWRKHGASGTFLSAPCRRSFGQGLEATMVYVIPKARLSRAWTSPNELIRMMAIAKATDAKDIRKACSSQQGTYDIMLHRKLRYRYCIIYYGEREDGSGFAVDDGKDFVENGGHSPHASFVKGLHIPNYFHKPSGPDCKPKERQQPKSRYSEQLRRMLEPPPGDASTMANKFPDLPKPESADQVDIGSKCVFKTSKGSRCILDHVDGRFCTRHHNMFNAERIMTAMKQGMRNLKMRRVIEDLEKWQMQESMRVSIEENPEKKRRIQEAQERVYRRLICKGLRVVPTEALGNCFFIAVRDTANLSTRGFTDTFVGPRTAAILEHLIFLGLAVLDPFTFDFPRP